MSWREESWPKKSSAENAPAQRAGTSAPLVLCAGIILLDKVFRVEKIPQPDSKVEAKDFFIVSGGCAANAAIAVVRLGGRAALAGPLGGLVSLRISCFPRNACGRPPAAAIWPKRSR